MKSLKQKKALVLGEDTRSFLTVIRSLARAGMLVDVVSFSNTSVALYSNKINQVYGFNHQSLTIKDWCEKIKALLINNQYDVVLPCDERALFPLLDIQQELKLSTKFALPNKEDLAPLFNKVDTRLTAEQCAIPVANGLLASLDSFNYQQITQRFGSPVVLKPTQSYDEAQLNKRQSVQIVKNEQDFIQFKQQYGSQQCLIESYFKGYGVGLSVLANQGQVTAAFAHARVSEPESGGGSSYRKAIPINPGMLYACQKFCLKLNYTGVAMFEFKYNEQTNDWILIEVNARFWGSLPLAVFAGIDFPLRYVAVLLNQPMPDKLTYNQNAYARNFSADFYDIKKQFEQQKHTIGTTPALINLTKRIASFARLLTGNEKIDSFQWDDQQPFWQELYHLVKDKLHKLPVIKQQIKRKNINNLQTVLQQPIQRVAFVCYGNIMRSPFAAKLFQQKIINSPLKHLTVESFGFHQIENRPAKRECINEAKAWQIDLSQHRSTWLQYQHCETPNTLFILFDKKNEYYLTSYYPKVNYVLLADLIPSELGFHAEIADPYDMPADYLTTCYQLIAAGLDTLIEHISNSNAKNN
jgi:protein-tyrosine-phosphatase/predicted ATP-grasp superfamily ATP-dependent carboligase